MNAVVEGAGDKVVESRELPTAMAAQFRYGYVGTANVKGSEVKAEEGCQPGRFGVINDPQETLRSG